MSEGQPPAALCLIPKDWPAERALCPGDRQGLIDGEPLACGWLWAGQLVLPAQVGWLPPGEDCLGLAVFQGGRILLRAGPFTFPKRETLISHFQCHLHFFSLIFQEFIYLQFNKRDEMETQGRGRTHLLNSDPGPCGWGTPLSAPIPQEVRQS